MNSDEKLLDAVYEKMKRGEPHSIQELDRFISFLAAVDFNNVSVPQEKDIAAIQSKLMNMMQQKFQPPQQQ